jgi:hypothetical protein
MNHRRIAVDIGNATALDSFRQAEIKEGVDKKPRTR